jgi:hypothetical protein
MQHQRQHSLVVDPGPNGDPESEPLADDDAESESLADDDSGRDPPMMRE